MLEIIEGQFGNCPTHPNVYIKTPMDFWQNGPEEIQIWDERSPCKYKNTTFWKKLRFILTKRYF